MCALKSHFNGSSLYASGRKTAGFGTTVGRLALFIGPHDMYELQSCDASLG